MCKSLNQNRNQPTTENTHTILVAEDDAINFVLIRCFLAGQNYHLIHAVNGREAVEKFQSEGNISLVLMDIRMPVMDGLTAAREIRKLDSNVPIVVQTAHVDKEEVAMQAGCNGFLAKPLERNRLVETIERLITRQVSVTPEP